MRTINLADVSPKRRYTAYPKYPECSNGVIDKLIELIENGETFTENTYCKICDNADCIVSTYPINDKMSLQLLIEDFEESDNPTFVDVPKLHMQIFRWNNIYYYLTY
jgi:hypothetical protein